jgi:Fic family protein
VRRSPVELGQRLTDAMRVIARENPRLQGVLDRRDFNATEAGQRLLEDESLARLMEILLQVVDLLFVQPILTANQVATALSVDFSTAQRYVNQLEEAGLVHEVTGKARNRVYRADQVLQAMEEPL